MNKLLLVIITTLLFTIAHTQTFQRQNNELVDAFVKRVFKVEELAHPIIETREWDSSKKIILCFVPFTKQVKSELETNDETFIVGYILIPTNLYKYKSVLIDTFFEDNGGKPKIETVFFANTDKDKQREVGVTISYLSIHKGAGIYGTYYDTHLYDNPNILSPQKKLTYFEKLSTKFWCFEGDSQGKSTKCKYKNVSAIRATLKQMGF